MVFNFDIQTDVSNFHCNHLFQFSIPYFMFNPFEFIYFQLISNESWLQPASSHQNILSLNISAFTSQFIWNFTATLWFLEDPSSTPVYVHAVIVLFTSEFDWLAPPCGTNLITCLKSVIIVQPNAGCLRCRRRNKKRRRDLLKKPRRSGTIGRFI